MNSSEEDAYLGLILAGRYRVIERLAEGAMGCVYRGEQVQLGRPVAIKFLLEPYTQYPQFIARFEREAWAMSQISHPNCVSVIDFGVEHVPYIVMDYVTGKTLGELLSEGPVHIGRTLHIAKQLLAALSHAHNQGIIHRDIKPENVMLSEATGIGDHVRIFDFGLAKLLDAENDAKLTHANIAMGTPTYMAPEQALALEVDARSDVYSTGVVLFELLAGRTPFVDDNPFNVMQMHRDNPPPTLAMAADGKVFSSELEAVVAQALAKDPAQRFQSAKEFADALMSIPESQLPAAVNAQDFPTVVAAPVVEESSKRWPLLAVIALTAVMAILAVSIVPAMGRETPSLAASRGTTEAAPKQGEQSATVAPSLDTTEAAPKQGEQSATVASSLDTTEAAPTQGEQSATLASSLDTTEAAPKQGEQSATVVPSLDTTEAAPKQGEQNVTVVPSLDTTEAAPKQGDVQEGEPLPGEGSIADARAGDSIDSEYATDEKTAAVTLPKLSEIRALLSAGQHDEAITALQTLRRNDPKNAQYPYMLAGAYFEKKWFKGSLEQYREAIRLNPGIRKKKTMNENLIAMLASDKTYNKVRTFIIQQVNRSALPYLRRAAKNDPVLQIRRRALSTASAISSAK